VILLKNMNPRDIANVISSNSHHQIMLFGHNVHSLLNVFSSEITCNVLFILEHPFSFSFPLKDNHYILECLNNLDPYEIFNFKRFINIIIYLPRLPNVCFHESTLYYKFLTKIFVNRINLIVKICRLLSLKLILLFKGGSIHFNSWVHVYPYFLEDVFPFFDLVLYFDGGEFKVVRGCL